MIEIENSVVRINSRTQRVKRKSDGWTLKKVEKNMENRKRDSMDENVENKNTNMQATESTE